MDFDTGKSTEINLKEITFWRIIRTAQCGSLSPLLTMSCFLMYYHTTPAPAMSKSSSRLSERLRDTSARSTRTQQPGGRSHTAFPGRAEAGSGRPSGREGRAGAPRTAQGRAAGRNRAGPGAGPGPRPGSELKQRGRPRAGTHFRPYSAGLPPCFLQTSSRTCGENGDVTARLRDRLQARPAAHRPRPGPTWSSTVPGPTRTVTRRPLGANTDTAAPPPPAAAIFPPGEEPRCARPAPPPAAAGTSGACSGLRGVCQPRERARRELPGQSTAPGSPRSAPGGTAIPAVCGSEPTLPAAARVTARKRRRYARTSSAPRSALRARPFT